MSSELEIEFKNLVTKEEFERIISEFRVYPSDMIEQHNYYFDTPLFDIKAKCCALRIRKKKNSFELTLKQPVEEGILETNETLTDRQANKMIEQGYLPNGEVRDKLQQINIPVNQVIYFGRLTTRRAEIEYLEGLLVFDNSSYLNKEDYEIEYEVKNKKIGEQNFLSLMDRLQIPIRATENKIMRFYKEYMKLRG
jgi:uncharacterized protein YjbK